MRPHSSLKTTARWLLLAAAALPLGAQADSVREILQEGRSWLVAQQDSQKRVDALDADTQEADAEYQRLLRQIEGLEAYNRQLGTQIAAQETEIARTEASISKATEVDRQLLPLLLLP